MVPLFAGDARGEWAVLRHLTIRIGVTDTPLVLGVREPITLAEPSSVLRKPGRR